MSAPPQGPGGGGSGKSGAVELNDILKIALKGNTSDIHIKAGLPPIFRIDGSLYPYKEANRLTPDMVNRMAFGIMNKGQQAKFRENMQVDLAYGVPGLGRFRVNIFQQRGTIGIVLRSIPFGILTLEQLKLPAVISKLSLEQRGLILVTGTTGSGKSTTLASMIDLINSTRTCHVVTIEDPIEFLHRDKKSIVNQREVGFDTLNFSVSLKAALRQDPDVILVGEMRDLETIEIALTSAETGHLVLSTLHTIDSTETITRIVTSFAPYQQKQVRIQLAGILKGIISQRLVPKADGKGRVPAIEVLVANARIRECIEDKERSKEIKDAVSTGHQIYGMQTFDQSLMLLFKQRYITFEEALRQSSNPDDFKLKVSGISGGEASAAWADFDGTGAGGDVSTDDSSSSSDDDDDGGDGGAGGVGGIDDLEIERF